MAQDRLNYIMTLHIHRGLTDDLSLIGSANRYIHGSDLREQIFGKFVATNVIETFYFCKHKLNYLEQCLKLF